MPRLVTLTTPIAIRDVRFLRLVGAVQDDDSASELTVVIAAGLQGGLPYSTHVLVIGQGYADGLRGKATPTGAGDAVEVFRTTAGVATAYASCKAAFAATGGNGLLGQLQTLGLLPAGAIS